MPTCKTHFFAFKNCQKKKTNNRTCLIHWQLKSEAEFWSTEIFWSELMCKIILQRLWHSNSKSAHLYKLSSLRAKQFLTCLATTFQFSRVQFKPSCLATAKTDCSMYTSFSGRDCVKNTVLTIYIFFLIFQYFEIFFFSEGRFKSNADFFFFLWRFLRVSWMTILNL